MITKKKTGLIIIILLSIIFLIFFFLLKKTYAYNDDENNDVNKYIESVASLVDEQTIGKYKNVVSIEDDRYISKLFNIKSGEEVSIESILKKEYVSLFWAKIKELLYLKYPKFIAEVLDKHNKTNAYFINDNELIIYFYDYEITPEVSEELFLHVNYNEIKDYLDITYKLDKEYQNEDGRVVQKNKKHIAITFDDGPSEYTVELSRGLKERRVQATFFLLGENMEGRRKMVEELVKDGHLIGNHSYHHVQLNKLSIEEATGEIEKTNRLIWEWTGEAPVYIRPPYGAWSQELEKVVDMIPVFWNVDSLDWKDYDADTICRRVTSKVQPGSIVLFHNAALHTPEALPAILDCLINDGYTVVPISQLILDPPYTIDHTGRQFPAETVSTT